MHTSLFDTSSDSVLVYCRCCYCAISAENENRRDCSYSDDSRDHLHSALFAALQHLETNLHLRSKPSATIGRRRHPFSTLLPEAPSQQSHLHELDGTPSYHPHIPAAVLPPVSTMPILRQCRPPPSRPLVRPAQDILKPSETR